MNNWYKQYQKNAGIVDSIKGIFTSNPKKVLDQESAYIEKVVSSLRNFIELNKDKIKPSKNGKRKLALWIWGNSLLKTLMQETPWNDNDVEMIGSNEQTQLLDKRMKIIIEKLRAMGYDARLDYEGKSAPVDLEVFF